MLGAIIIAPFVCLFGAAIINPSVHFTVPTFSFSGISFSALGMALYFVMWNFLGWDNTTTYAGEVDKPVKSYLISSAIASGTVIVLYLLTTYITINSGVNFEKLSDEGYPLLGKIVAGPWLAAFISIGGMASAMGIFAAVMLSISRIPKAMADDNLFPKWLAKPHKKYQTPYVSILVTATIVSLMDFWSFKELIVIDVILYGAGISLEFISLIVLRYKEPDAHRPFKVNIHPVLLSCIMLLPIGLYISAMVGILIKPNSSHFQVYFALLGLLSAPIAWFIIKRRKK
jgi:amino acid transporter